MITSISLDKKYNVICYRLKRDTKPKAVLFELEHLFQKYNVSYSECLFCLRVAINEYEYEGKMHSNREKNAVLTILKHHSRLNEFLVHERSIHEDGNINEHITIRNFSESDLFSAGRLEYSLVKEIAEKIPRPYAVNDMEIVFSGISFQSPKGSTSPCGIRSSETGLDSPVGDYISYSYTKYGNEMHSYVFFSVDDKNLDLMRRLFFEFAERVPGKYQGTEYRS